MRQGEDPYLGGEYGVQYVSGLQGGNDGGFLKAASIVKHAFDYDLEGTHGPTDRGGFNAIVSAADQVDYFWPPFKAAVSRANASGLMCRYSYGCHKLLLYSHRLNLNMMRSFM